MARKLRIRPVALCVFQHEGRILVAKGRDRSNGAAFYRPLGGGIRFGETGAQALVRELREELEEEICALRYLGTLESIFHYRDRPRHELLRIYDAEFVDRSAYERPFLQAHEGERRIRARWLAPSALGDAPLVPEGLPALLQPAPCR